MKLNPGSTYDEEVKQNPALINTLQRVFHYEI
jgi:hypothetical protein